MTEFALPWCRAILTQNTVRRMHFHAEAKAKAQAISEARAAIRAAGVEPRWSANVTLHYRPGSRRSLDADGLAPTLKCLLDALVKEGILPDDSWVEVPQAAIRIHPPKPGLPGVMWAELTPVEEDDDAA